MMSVSVKIDMNGVYKKLSTQNFNAGKRSLANQSLVDMNENFVPMRGGDLRMSATLAIDASFIIWNSVYAKKHYYLDFSPNYTTSGTGPYWDLKAKNIFMSDWIEAFKRGARW